MIYTYIALAAFAVGVGFTVTAAACLIVQGIREEHAAALWDAKDEAIALTLPGALGKPVDVDPHGDLTFQAMQFEAWEDELT
jgi:hypothetical protein